MASDAGASTPDTAVPPPPSDASQAPAAPWNIACSDPAESLDVAPSAAELAKAQGTILRCSDAGSLDASELDRLARSSGYTGAPLSTGARLLHLSYRTTRATEPPRPGFGVATVILPHAPRAPALPVVVVAHGTVGEAPACPPSRESPHEDNTYLAELGYSLAGYGYAVILPDFAGYAAFGAADNPPAGYHAAEDEARSVLDAARALRGLASDMFRPDVVLVGHSQGGHAALSALAAHERYGSGGTLAAVVALAPSWFPMTAFPGMVALASSFPLPAEADSVAASVWYHYSHAELLDGPGSALSLFAPAKRVAIRSFFESSCNPQDLAALGKDIGELFDSSFATNVAYFAGAGLPCVTDLCTKWVARYHADRPHITGAARTTPILVVHGDADDWIPPERATCGFDRLASDGANATICIVPGAKHDPVVGMKAEYVARWIASHALHESDPGPCGPGRDALHDEMGNVASCAGLPPND